MKTPIGTRRVSKPRITKSRLLILGLLMAFLAVIATVGLLRVYPPSPIHPEPKPADGPAKVATESLEIVILSTEANRSYFKSFGGGEAVIIRPWQDVFRKIGIRHRMISSLDEWKGELLLLPHAYCLSDNEFLLIEKGIDEGDGVLIAGPLGVRNPNGSWNGWERMHALLGSTGIREFGAEEMMFIYLSPDGPVGTRSLSGYRLSLDKRPSQWGISGLPSAAMWTNWMREPNPYSDKPHSAAAVGKIGAGKFAWIGFDPDLPVQDIDNIRTYLTFIREMVLWCADIPACEKDLWPRGKETALLLATDTEHEFQNALLIDTVLSFHGIRGGFMCVSDIANDYPEIVKSLSERHDIGSHSDDHQRFDGQPLKQQIERLERSAADLSNLTGRPVLGLRPPEEGVDQATYKALVQAGYQYVLGSGHTRSALPEIIPTPTRENPDAFVIEIPRAQRDDYQLLEVENPIDMDVLEDLLFDFEKTRYFNGIDYVSLHTQVMGRTECIKNLEQFLARIPLEELWITGPDGLAGWWVQRNAVKTSIKRENDEFVLFVENSSTEPIYGLGIWVSLPGNPDHLQVEGEVREVYGPDPRGAYRVDMQRIDPGEILLIRLKPESKDWATVTTSL